MKKFMYIRAALYVILTVFLVFVIVGAINIPCYWREKYNLICPACGMTRATRCIAKLDFVNAVKYHAIYTCVLVPFAMHLILNDIYIILKRGILKKDGISYIEILCGCAKSE